MAEKRSPAFSKWLIKMAMVEGAALAFVILYFGFLQPDMKLLIICVVSIALITGTLLVRKLKDPSTKVDR